MGYRIERLIAKANGTFERYFFEIEGCTVEIAKRVAGMLAYNVEHDRGLHQGKRYSDADFQGARSLCLP